MEKMDLHSIDRLVKSKAHEEKTGEESELVICFFLFSIKIDDNRGNDNVISNFEHFTIPK